MANPFDRLVRLVRSSAFVLLACAMQFANSTHAQEVIPDLYKDPGIYPNRNYVNQHVNEHIDPFTGALQHHYVDLFLPGNGAFDLKVVRAYNTTALDSGNPAGSDSSVGMGWTMHFGRILKPKTNLVCNNQNALSVADNPTLELPDGSRQLLAFTGSTSPLMLTAQRWRADCVGNGLTVYSPDGTRYDMTQFVNVGTAVAPVYAVYATKITDKNGNYATVSYAGTSSPEITGVSTNDGRTISFSYLDSGMATRRVSRISGPDGQVYEYAYLPVPNLAGSYFLTNVRRPDGTSWNYAYNGNLGTAAGSYWVGSGFLDG